MSHVDEGTLHAYLDGALDAVLPEAEAARVREHLAVCDTCAAHLEEERALRDEAAVLLGVVAPLPAQPPSFEDVRAMARVRTDARGANHRAWRLGWAASLVLAAGAGWLLRGASVPLVVQEQVQPVAILGPVPGPTPPSTSPQGAPSTTPTPNSTPKPSPISAPTATPPSTSSPSLTPPPTPSSMSRQVPTAAADEAGLTSPRRARANVSPDADVVRPGASVPRFDTPAFPRSLAEAKAAVEPIVAAPTLGDSRDEARIPSRSLAVPGIEVLSVGDLASFGIQGGVKVLQLLSSGDTLELVHLPRGVDPSVLPPVREGLDELVVKRADGWLVARAPGGRDRLRALVHRMDGGA